MGGAGISRGLKVFLAVDLVLVLALVVAAVVVLSRGDADDTADRTPTGSVSGPSSPASGSSTGASAGASSPAVADPGTAVADGPASFASPSGNIACTMSADGATCTIANFTYAPPTVAGCTGTVGHVIVLNADGVAAQCVDGPAPAVAPAETPVLEYGHSSTVGPYTCTSATDGVTCVETASGTGFRLARASLTMLP